MIALTKSFEVTHKAIAITDAEMAAIRRYALAPLSPDQVFAGRMKLANDQYDRTDERFPISYLEQFAKTLPGKSVMRGHDYSLDPDGLFYNARVAQDDQTGGYVLVADYYLLADNPLVPKIQAGIARFVSIGFTYDKRFCDLDGQDYDRYQPGDEGCPHLRGEAYDGAVCTLTYGGDASKVEALEGSFVWLGAQRGAETLRGGPAAMRKASDGDARHVAKRQFLTKQRADEGREGGVMDPQETAAFEGRLKEMETKLAAAEAELRSVEAKRADQAPLAAEGMAYREWQRSEITRLYTSMGKPDTAAILLKALGNATAGDLAAVRVEAERAHAEMFAPTGGGQPGGTPGETIRRSVDEILYGARPRREGV